MSNEELVERIRAGEKDLMPQLWEQVERFVAKLANKWACALHWVSFEDLYQSGYIALVEAVATYDQEQGMTFVGWLVFYLKKAFLDAAGYRSERQRRDPLHGATSLDLPVGEDGSTTIGDLQEDPNSTQGFEEVEKQIWRDQLRVVLDMALQGLREPQRAIIEKRYYSGMTAGAIGAEMGMSESAVRSNESAALRSLRHSKTSKQLRSYIEERTPYFMSVGVKRFKSTHCSAVEEVVMLRERLMNA